MTWHVYSPAQILDGLNCSRDVFIAYTERYTLINIPNWIYSQVG